MLARISRWTVSLFGTATLLVGQAPSPSSSLAPSLDPSGSIPRQLTRVLTDAGSEGTWALGQTYKMHFDEGGATFWPYLGPQAERRIALRFRVESARHGDRELPWQRDAAPHLDGGRVTYDRGAFAELWDLRLENVEQTFRVRTADGDGDLVVRLTVDTELPCREQGEGLCFDLPEGGAVVYGSMHVHDERGASFDARSRWIDGGIELRVPARFVAAARGEITIDPIVSITQVGTPSDDLRFPDVAYNALSDRYLVVCERFFSRFDVDIIGLRLSGANLFVEEVPIEISSRESLNPAVAGNVAARQFLVVWDEDRPLDRIVRGRAVSSNSGGALGTAFTVVDDPQTENVRPDIGGSPGTGEFPDRYVVVCEEVSNSTPSNLRVLVVTTTGSVVSSMFPVQGIGPETQLAVTKTRGEHGRWMVVFRDASSNIACLITTSSGLINLPPLTVGSLGVTTNPAVAGDGQRFFIVWESQVVGRTVDIHGAVIEFSRNLMLPRIGETNLTALESGASTTSDQTQPCVSYDGCRYVYTYIERNNHPFSATVFVDAAITLHEQHQPLELSTFGVATTAPQTTSRFEGGGQPGRHMIVWNRLNPNHFVAAGHYDGVRYGFGAQPIRRIQTGCGAFEPDITSTDPPALGAQFTVTTDPIQPVNQLMLFGLPAGVPFPLCTTSGANPTPCSLGVFPLILSVPGNTLTVPIPCDPTVLGAGVAFQGVYVINFGGCPAAALGVPLYVSDTLHVTVG